MTADAYEHLGSWGLAEARSLGLTATTDDDGIDGIREAMMFDIEAAGAEPPFDVSTLGPAIATWRDDLAVLAENAAST